MESILMGTTMLVTFLCGIVSRKISWFNNNLIPIQNLLIGITTSIVYYIYTKDLSIALASAGLFAGGIYDIGNNLKKIFNQDEKIKTESTDAVG